MLIGFRRNFDCFTTTTINLIVLDRNGCQGRVLWWYSWWPLWASRYVARLSYWSLDDTLTVPRRNFDLFISSSTTTTNDAMSTCNGHNAMVTIRCSQCDSHSMNMMPTMRCSQCDGHDTMVTMRWSRCNGQDTIVTMRCPCFDAHDSIVTLRYSRYDAQNAMMSTTWCPQCDGHDTMIPMQWSRCDGDSARVTMRRLRRDVYGLVPTMKCSQRNAHNAMSQCDVTMQDL